jgi:hypothetical protein
MDVGRLNLQRIRFEPGAVLDPLAATFAAQAARKGLGFVVDAAPHARDMPLCGDPLRLGQILRNLVDNAIKFTAHGRIGLYLGLEDEGSAAVTLRVQVQDSGIGIAQEDQARIFSGFQQADGSSTRKFGGVGLGLTICTRLVQMMDGEMGVRSVAGDGSTFWFTVRLDRAALATVAPVLSDEGAAAPMAGHDLRLLGQVLSELQVLLACGNVKANRLVSAHGALLKAALGAFAPAFEQQVAQFQPAEALRTLAQARQHLGQAWLAA